MRNLFITALFFSFLFANNVFADGLDVDYNFIDTAFDGIKPVTQKEFNDTINRLTPQPVEDTFGGKLKAFLFGRKYGQNVQQPVIDVKELDIGGEKKAIQDIKNGVYYIRIVVPIIDSSGNIIPLGDYKIKEKSQDNMLVFIQGQKEYGTLKLRSFEDNLKKENDITYSRVDIVNDNVLRIVYATLKETRCAYAKIYNER